MGRRFVSTTRRPPGAFACSGPILVTSLSVALAALFFGGCGADDGPDAPSSSLPDTSPPDDTLDLPDVPDGPPPPGTPGLCGNQLHDVITAPPNIYFVFDASGSMTLTQNGLSRYGAVRHAARDLMRSLGPKIAVGAALFPGPTSAASECDPGFEVFPITQGDPIPESPDDPLGPVTKAFLGATDVDPAGGTPVSSTLTSLLPALAETQGTTIVVLATDGGPNCNPNTSCGAEECQPTLEGFCDDNCCAPGGLYGPLSCIDRSATLEAIAAIRDVGIDVVVVGIPGSETYETVLSQMALVGGAAHADPPFYYRVDQLAELGDTFSSIAGTVIPCDFELAEAPPDPAQTNVYLDGQVLPYDETDGWIWTGPAAIALVGGACSKLKSGEIKTVQIVSGCPTETAE